MNSVKIIPESKLFFILHENNIHFPYHITKASGIKLGLENDVEFIIWGNIITSTKQVELKSYIINLKDYSQKYLPLLKFEVRNFYILQNELLKEILKFYKQQNVPIHYPQLNLDYFNYELLVKSFLVKDPTKKISFLKKAYMNKQNSDFLNFELAKAYMSAKNHQRANYFLEKVSDNALFRHNKNFLKALILFNHGYSNLAIEKFINLQKENRFSFEIENNLGAIYLKQKYHATAEKFFLSALEKKKDPRIYLNYLKSLMESGKILQAIETINIALAYFPSSEKLKTLFFYYVYKNINKKVITNVFKKYIADLSPVETIPEIPIRMINPLDSALNNSNHFQSEVDKIRQHYYSGDLNKTLENGEDILVINPFVPEVHHLMSTIYLKQRQLFKAEMYALSSNYLKRTKDNYLILIEIHKLLNNHKKVNELRSEISRLFPDSEN
jgi:Tfp pilus assembly protein PilF